ncbi:MAG TPA: hypothetical protein VGO85_07955 [Caldimonas sp.]|jgi:hypothetical protein|nr:hypothetical protein [Caldimonas sp.]
MRQESPELALVAIATPGHPQHPERAAPFGCSGPGWFDSSWDLHRGLEVREGWSDDDRVRGWIEDFLCAQRAVGRTASPSASTAIA